MKLKTGKLATEITEDTEIEAVCFLIFSVIAVPSVAKEVFQ